MAAAERIGRGHLGRMPQLALLAPDTVEAVLNGQPPEGMGLPRSLERFPVEWNQQRMALSRWVVPRCLPDGGPEGTVGRMMPA